MSFLRYTVLIWTCLLVITGIEALYCECFNYVQMFHMNDGGEGGSLIYSVESCIHEYCIKQQRDEQIVESSPKRAVRVAMSRDPSIIYWLNIDGKEKTIMRTRNFYTEIIVDKGLVTPEELAVDWITENIYFMDSSKKHIGVCTEDGSYCTTILNSTTDTPGGLVLNPKRGEMFWSDYGKNPSIWRAGMDGSGPKPILTEDLGWPKGLAIDYSKDRLYWIDSKLKTVESMSLDGKDRQRFLQTEGKRLHSLAIFDDKLYWSDWEKNVIESMDLDAGDNRDTLVYASGLIYDMEIRHSSLKPSLPNPCENADCSEICLLAPDSKYTCACKLGNKLNSDSHTCSPINEIPHLVIVAGNKMIHYREEIIGRARINVTLMPIRMSRIAYDRKTRNLIVDDQFTHFLHSFDPVNSEIRRLTPINSKYFSDIDINSRDNVMFWVASGSRKIYKFRDETVRSENFSNEPHEILSIPGSDSAFVVFRTGPSSFRIDWLNLNRFWDSRTVIPMISGTKVSLAYDEQSMRLYFAYFVDTYGMIESIHVGNIICAGRSGSNHRQVLGSDVGNPVSLAILNGKLYWTNLDSIVLNWLDLDDDNLEIKSTNLPIDEHSGMTDIVSVGNFTVPDKISCRDIPH